MQKLFQIPFHPILIGIYPATALLAHNIAEIEAWDAAASLLASLVGASVLFLLLTLLLREGRRAALAGALLLILFFSYGHVYNSLEAAGIFLGRHRLLAPLWLLLAVGLVGWALKRARDLKTVTQALNLMAVIALVFPLVTLISYELRSRSTGLQALSLPDEVRNLQGSSGHPPDIYYIILDTYARDDALKDEFDLDNTPFLAALEELGFYVARCSLSNYAQTDLSLASSLNFNYLEALDLPLVRGSQDKTIFQPYIKHSAAREALEALGYSFVAFDTNFFRTSVEDADIYFSNRGEMIGRGMNGFEVMFLKTTAGILVEDAAEVLPAGLTPDLSFPEAQHREKIRYILDKLPQIPTSVAGPKFVFAHLVSPHAPFVFGPEGEPVSFPDGDGKDYIPGYVGQVSYLNARLISLLRQIIQDSPTPPVIILQGDHGSGRFSPRSRMQILNAYYFPGAEGSLYESISPVNTFRIFFNQYFGGQLPLLEDLSYYSHADDPYAFKPIQDDRKGCGG